MEYDLSQGCDPMIEDSEQKSNAGGQAHESLTPCNWGDLCCGERLGVEVVADCRIEESSVKPNCDGGKNEAD